MTTTATTTTRCEQAIDASGLVLRPDSVFGACLRRGSVVQYTCSFQEQADDVPCKKCFSRLRRFSSMPAVAQASGICLRRSEPGKGSTCISFLRQHSVLALTGKARQAQQHLARAHQPLPWPGGEHDFPHAAQHIRCDTTSEESRADCPHSRTTEPHIVPEEPTSSPHSSGMIRVQLLPRRRIHVRAALSSTFAY